MKGTEPNLLLLTVWMFPPRDERETRRLCFWKDASLSGIGEIAKDVDSVVRHPKIRVNPVPVYKNP
jgi:hypothetical protein